jgi:hypothetical protein
MPKLPKESVLDLVVGGSLLPHIYCTKITVDKQSNNNPHLKKVTVNFEIYEDQKNLESSQWLQSLSLPGFEGKSLLDALFIQVLPVTKKENFDRLKPSRDPAAGTVAEGNSSRSNIYLAHMIHGDGYLPRAPDELNSSKNPNIPYYGPYFPEDIDVLKNDLGLVKTEPFRVSTSSLLGNLNGADVLPAMVAEGKITEKIIGKKVYYVIPFEYTFLHDQLASNQLGLMFYSYLSVAGWLKSMGGDMAGLLPASLIDYESLILEGPINTEIIYEPGNKLSEKRETFLQGNGQYWEGSVHYHSDANPAPDGYTGWMAGEKHKASANQPKLQLIETPNYKIVDTSTMSNNVIADPPDQGISGMGVDYTVGLGPAYESAQDLINYFAESQNVILKPSSESEIVRKHFSGDNDSEYSNFYITRDKDNNARGMFFINFRNMLRNNSHLFHVFTKFGRDQAINLILSKSKLLELRLYRDRVKKNLPSIGTEKFENDEVYEEASRLVGTISDIADYKSASNNENLMEVSLDSTQDFVRYFMFSDYEISNHSSGMYQYRVEVDFKDGTYDVVQTWLNNLQRARAKLAVYYDLSISGDNLGVEPGSYQQLGGFQNSSENYDKTFFKPYYDANAAAFRDEFLIAAMNLKGLDYEIDNVSYYIWEAVPNLIDQAQALFLKSNPPQQMFSGLWMKLVMLMYPGSFGGGSPQGIQLVMKILDGWIQKLQSITKSVKRKSTGSELNAKTSSALKSDIVYEASPSRSIINETHTYDHPSQMFTAISNKDVYKDYLSVGEPLFTNFYGLRDVTKEYYQKRCQLDAVKFSPLAVNGFSGGTNQTNIAMKYSMMGPEPTFDGEVSFETTGYSFLTPSILEISDPGEKNVSFDFYISIFDINAWFALNGAPTPPFNSGGRGVLSKDSANSFVTSLLNYNNYKTNIDFADLGDAYYDMQESLGVDDASMQAFGGVLAAFIQKREPSKNIFDNISVTLHEEDKHDSFFKKPSGFIDSFGQANPVPGFDPSYPPNIQNDFSDGTLLVDNYLYKIMHSPLQNVVKMPVGTNGSNEPGAPPIALGAADYKHLPNSFKMKFLHNNRVGLGESGAVYVQPKFIHSMTSNDPMISSLKYINFNLTSRIEVFSLHKDTIEFSKNDEPSWKLLQKSHITNLGLGDKLFCRIRYFDPRLVQGMELPILDKYFLISDEATTAIPKAPKASNGLNPGAVPDMSIDQGDVDFWRGQNQKTVEKLKNMTEKGKQLSADRDPTNKSTKVVASMDRADEPYRGGPNVDKSVAVIAAEDAQAESGNALQNTAAPPAPDPGIAATGQSAAADTGLGVPGPAPSGGGGYQGGGGGFGGGGGGY